MTATTPAPSLVHLAGLGVAHLPECPHIVGRGAVPVGPEEQGRLPVCTWSQNEIDGFGREYFDSLDRALDSYGSPVGVRRLVRESLAGLEWDQVWVVYSRSYVALGRQGRSVATVGIGYVHLHGGEFIELPGFRANERGDTSAEPRRGETCGICWIEKSLSGVCDNCD